MKRFAAIVVAGAMVVLAYADNPSAIPQAKISGGMSIQPPLTQQGTLGGNLQGGLRRGGSTTIQPLEPPPRGDDCGRHDRPRKIVVIPGYGSYGGYYYGDSAMRDLADAEWAKVRLMEEELRLKEEKAKMEYEAKMAELEAKKAQMIRQDQKTSWDRAVAMYPPLLDPKSKMRVWYDHLIKRAQEMTDRWGQPVRVPELDAPDYPEIFAHRAAEHINLKPLPLPPPQTVQVADTIVSPPQSAPASESTISVDHEMPD